MFCRKCSKKLDLQDKFCNNCGEPVILEDAEEATIVPEPPKDLVWNVEGFPKDKIVEDVIFDWKTDRKGEDFIVDDFYINENKNVSAQQLLDQELEKINRNNMAREEAILAAQAITATQAVSAARRVFSKEIKSDLEGIVKRREKYQTTKDLDAQSEIEAESNTEELSKVEPEVVPEFNIKPEAETESEIESNLESNPEADTETQTESAESEIESEIETESAESEIESNLESNPEADTEPQTESNLEADTEPQTDADTDEITAAIAAAAAFAATTSETAAAAAATSETAAAATTSEPAAAAVTSEATTAAKDVENLNIANKTELKYDDIFVGEEEEPKTKKFFLGRFLLVLLILLIILEGVFLGFKYYMPDNPYFKIVDNKVTQAVLTVESWFQVKEPAAEMPKAEESAIKESVAKEPAAGEPVNPFPENKNIKKISMNPNLAYTSGKNYGNADINKSLPVIESTDQVIETIVEYDSKWIDYVNSGDKSVLALTAPGSQAEKNALTFTKAGKIKETFNFLEIGEVRKGTKGYYIWVREEIEMLENNLNTTKVYNWIYQLTPVENQMKIVNYFSYK